MTHEVMRLPSGHALDERRVFTVGGEVTTREAPLRRLYRWEFHAMKSACASVGLASVESHVFDNDKGFPTATCLARV